MPQITKVELRNLRIEDYTELKSSMVEAYSEMEGYWKEHQIKRLLEIFPEGQLVILVDDKVVGSALSLIVTSEQVLENHSYTDITGNYTFSTHNPLGDVLYGIDVLSIRNIVASGWGAGFTIRERNSANS